MTKGGIDRSLALGWLDVNQVALAGPSVKSSIEMIRIRVAVNRHHRARSQEELTALCSC